MIKKNNQTNSGLEHSVGKSLVYIEVIIFACVKMNCRKVTEYVSSSPVSWTEMQISKGHTCQLEEMP